MELIIDDISFATQNLILTSLFHQSITNFLVDHAFGLNFFYKTHYFANRENYLPLNIVVNL
jgi:hypothetical protein